MTQKTEIKANAIYKVTDKGTGETCWYVPSDSQPDHYYKTCWNRQETCWTCTCKAGQHGIACKHAKAAQVSIVVNKEQFLLERSQEPYLPPITDVSTRGDLNGGCGGHGFSLLK